MLKGIQKLLNSDGGRYIISILLGLGLSTLFRNACNDRKCLVFKAVSPEQVKDKIFKVGEDCYKYTNHQVTCDSNNKDELTF
tara:strand:+ start:151 stop:396 length:246 start_codon:yes stop_codon:yes gene_type:complete